jgi:hypothetical protein
MTLRRVRWAAASLGIVACALVAACGSSASPTGIVAEVTTDLQVPADLDEVKVVATSASDASLFEQSYPLTGPSARTLPLRVGFEETGSATVPFRIEAIGLHAGAQVVSRSATLAFLRGRVVILPLPLLGLCRGVVCAQAATTCLASGTCGSDTTDPGGLPPYRPGLDGGAGGAGGSDGGIDSRTGADTPAADAPSIETPADVAGDRGTGDAPQVVPSLNDGLVSYWPFDSDANPLPDRSGNGNDLLDRLAMSFWTPNGAYGGGIDLTPSGWVQTDFATVNNYITGPITVGAFALISPPTGAVRTIIMRRVNVGSWELALSENGALRFTLGTQVIVAPAAITTVGEWVHVAGTYDGNTAILYVAGAPVFSSVVGAISLNGNPTGSSDSGTILTVGATANTTVPAYSEFYNGPLDEITLHSRALTASEVAALAAGVFPMRK